MQTEKRFDVIVIGELNVDLIMNRIPSFPQIGKEILAGDMTLTLGSSSAIFASNLSSLGLSVAFLGKLGNDIFGDFVLKSLQEKKVDTSLIIRSATLQTGATVALSYKDERAMITHPGAMESLTISDIAEGALKQARHLHFSNCFAQAGLKNDIKEMFCRAKKYGLTTSFDTQCDPLEEWDLNLAEILPLVDVFLPNEEELLSLTRKKDLAAAVGSILDFSNIIVVKQGNKGSVSATKNDTLFVKAFVNNDPVDAIGAGDSFNAGFIYQWLQNRPVPYCQRFGNLIGAISTTAAGGTTAFNDIKNTLVHAKEKFGYTEEQ